MAKLKPAAVVGFGGYPSVPTVLLAQRARVPTVLHEQNAVLGRANRLAARGAVRIATSSRQYRRVKPADAGKLCSPATPSAPTSHPFATCPTRPWKTVARSICWWSAAARVPASSARSFPRRLALLPDTLKRRIRIAQQCRPEDIEAAKAAFAKAGIEAELSTFFRDVPERLAGCHLAICRSGASTVAELAAVGRPAILVPYPYAMDDHQTANAQAVADAGGAWLMPQTAFTAASLAGQPDGIARPARDADQGGGSGRPWRHAAGVPSAARPAGRPRQPKRPAEAGADHYSTEAAE